MREEKILVRVLRGIAELVAHEAERNPDFAERLERILAEIPKPMRAEKRRPIAIDPASLPDVFAELKNRGEMDFEAWLLGLEVPVLRALIKQHDLDASKRSRKWTEPEKLARLIAEQLHARLNRGGSFLKPQEPNP